MNYREIGATKPSLLLLLCLSNATNIKNLIRPPGGQASRLGTYEQAQPRTLTPTLTLTPTTAQNRQETAQTRPHGRSGIKVFLRTSLALRVRAKAP